MRVYTARMIAEIENERRDSLYNIIQNFSVSNVLLFIKKRMGIGTTDKDAYAELDKTLEGKDLPIVYKEIMEQLTKDGFLDRKVNLEELEVPQVSPKSGKKEKKQQSK